MERDPESLTLTAQEKEVDWILESASFDIADRTIKTKISTLNEP